MLASVYAARTLRDEFDGLWNTYPNATPYAAVLQTVRCTSLLNCFSPPLNLLCSATLWQYTLGEWARKNNVEGPLPYPASGDTIERFIEVFEGNEEKIKAIFSLYRTDNERMSLDEDAAHIQTTVKGAQESLKRWRSILNIN